MTVTQERAVRAAASSTRSRIPNWTRSLIPSSMRTLIQYVLAGVWFGIVLVKAEVISWYKIQEMLRLQSWDLYLVFVSAIAVATISLALLRRYGRTLSGEPIVVPPKVMARGHRYWIGGLIFGVGLAFTGACPGPLFAMIGSGATIMLVPFASALLGTWTYGWLRPKLPH